MSKYRNKNDKNSKKTEPDDDFIKVPGKPITIARNSNTKESKKEEHKSKKKNKPKI